MARQGVYRELGPNVTPEVRNLAVFLRELVSESKLTLHAVGRRTNYDKATISRALNGNNLIDTIFLEKIIAVWAECTGADPERTADKRREGENLLALARTARSARSDHPGTPPTTDHATIGPQPREPAAGTLVEPTNPPAGAHRSSVRAQPNRLRKRLLVACVSVTLFALVATLAGITAVSGTPDPETSDTGNRVDAATNNIPLISLNRYWNESYHDNLTTTEDPASAALRSEMGEYKPFRTDSYVFAKQITSHARCLTPLVRYTGRQSDGEPDQATTTDPAWRSGNEPASYEKRAIIGYIYRPDLPQPPGTRKLYLLYNKQRGYFTASEPKWAGRVGDVKEDGYVVQRFDGYVLTGLQARPCPENT